jgi:hypothetical protein
MIVGEYGKAAFDAVGPLLLIGWAEVGPTLLQAMLSTCKANAMHADDVRPETWAIDARIHGGDELARLSATTVDPDDVQAVEEVGPAASAVVDDDLLEKAMQEDAHHWAICQRPIQLRRFGSDSASVPRVRARWCR